MHATGRFGTNAQSHTPVVAVFQRTTAHARTKVFAHLRYLRIDDHDTTCTSTTTRNDTFQVVVISMVNKKLREYRRRAGLPLEVLAFKARVSPRTLWRWERWNCTPRSWESIQRVAAVLGVQPEELVDDENEHGGER